MIGNWTVVFEDKMIINQTVLNDEGFGTRYVIEDDAFWSKPEFSNIWAIQKDAPNINDEVEHRDHKHHCSLSDEGIDFQQFIDKWDVAHLAQLQADWDADERDESEKGPRPTSYSS